MKLPAIKPIKSYGQETVKKKSANFNKTEIVIVYVVPVKL